MNDDAPTGCAQSATSIPDTRGETCAWSATPLVAAIMGVARALRLSVVAERIEEPAQLEEIRALDCDAGQGYLFMRPQPPTAWRHYSSLMPSRCPTPRPSGIPP
ncbi:MAG: EAL domain-containing protein [Actinomycetota bacterium]